MQSYGVTDVRDELNSDIWDGMKMNRAVRGKLLVVAKKFIDYVDCGSKALDVVITGSSASYNWSKLWSDIDLHVIFDVDTTTAEGETKLHLIEASKSLWNDTYSIKIKGLPVELYGQARGTDTVNGGLYSIITNRWIKTPKKVVDIPDWKLINSKAETLTKEIYATLDSNPSSSKLESLARKISRMRKAGLTKKGLYSTENLAFKALRRSGAVADLYAAIDAAKSKELSLS